MNHQLKVKAKCRTCGKEGFEFIDNTSGGLPELKLFDACIYCTPASVPQVPAEIHILRFNELTSIGRQIERWLDDNGNLVQGSGL